jgi:hypothetical protein
MAKKRKKLWWEDPNRPMPRAASPAPTAKEMAQEQVKTSEQIRAERRGIREQRRADKATRGPSAYVENTLNAVPPGVSDPIAYAAGLSRDRTNRLTAEQAQQEQAIAAASPQITPSATSPNINNSPIRPPTGEERFETAKQNVSDRIIDFFAKPWRQAGASPRPGTPIKVGAAPPGTLAIADLDKLQGVEPAPGPAGGNAPPAESTPEYLRWLSQRGFVQKMTEPGDVPPSIYAAARKEESTSPASTGTPAPAGPAYYRKGNQFSDQPFKGAEKVQMEAPASRGGTAGGSTYNPTGYDNTDPYGLRRDSSGLASEINVDGGKAPYVPGRTRQVLEGNQAPSGFKRISGGLGSRRNVGVAGSDATFQEPVFNPATDDITQRYGYSRIQLSPGFRPNPNARLTGRRLAGASEGGDILREFNRINDRADREYDKAIRRGLNSKAAARRADAIRARGEQLIGMGRNQIMREGIAADQDYRAADLGLRYQQLAANTQAALGEAGREQLDSFIESAAASILPPGLENAADKEQALGDARLRIMANLPANWATLSTQGRAEAMQNAAAEAGFLAELSKEAGVAYYSMGDLLSGNDKALRGGKLSQRDLRFWRALIEDGPWDALKGEVTGATEILLPGTNNHVTVNQLRNMYRLNRRARQDTFAPPLD